MLLRERWNRYRSVAIAFLNARPARFYLLVGAIMYAIVTVSILARYDFNPTALIRFGHYYISVNEDLTPTHAIRLLGNEAHGGNGYDGQIFYYYARSLFLAGEWPEGFSHAYRAPRIGFPLLVAPFNLFGAWGVVAGMYIVQLGLLAAGLIALYHQLAPERKYLAIFYALAPFSLVSFSLMVSNSVMISLALIGYHFDRRSDERNRVAFTAIAFVCYSLAIFSKESALFFLFPLGLHALFQRDVKRILLMVAILVPVFAWQIYLRHAHGMVPAQILSIFLEPLDGVRGVVAETWELSAALFAEPSLAAAIEIAKHAAKMVLLLIIVGAVMAAVTGNLKKAYEIRIAVALTLMSVLIADYYYFWGIFDNIMRMFTWLAALVVLLRDRDPDARTGLFFTATMALSLFVFLRLVFLSPTWPHDTYVPYDGPHYESSLEAKSSGSPGTRR